jgi:multiple sugar transport system permease protein
MAISANKQTLILDSPGASSQRWRRRFGPDLDGYSFILPAAIIMICLVVYPFCLALYYSVSDKLIGEESHLLNPLWDNFLYIITMDDIFRQTLKNTLIFATVSVVLKMVFGLGAAL